MKAILFYLSEVIAGSGILYCYYHLFLRNKKFHQYNRYYLLLATVISICIPFLNIPVYFDTEESKPLLIKTLAIFSSDGFEENVIAGNSPVHVNWFTWKNTVSSLYLLIITLLFIRLIISLIRITRLVQIYPGEKIDTIYFVNTYEPSAPFSFFRWLFWNNKIEINSDYGQQILRHELFHIRQKHSWDIIFFEIVTMIFWINPFFHLIKKEIRAIHEFLADQFGVHKNREWDYAELLLMQVLGSPHTSLTNPFFHNQIKRRIIMLTTSKKTGYQYLRKIMVLPLAAIIVGLFSFTYKTKTGNKTLVSEKPITVVIDAGHGGNDRGAMAPGNKYNEAQLSLEIAKALQSLAKEYNINIVMTREDQQLPGKTSDKNEANKKRVEIANEVKADAFISIHINLGSPDKEYQSEFSGIEAYVSNKRNDEKGKQLASIILQQLSVLYKTSEELKYRSDQGIFVLDQNNCPSVLLECGFINNTEDLAFITSKTNQEKIAKSILESIAKYSNNRHEKAKPLSLKDTIPSKIMDRAISYEKKDPIILQADTIIWESDEKVNTDAENKLIVFNGKIVNSSLVHNKKITARRVTVYEKNNINAIALYGKKAKAGVAIFEDAAIVGTAKQ